MMIAAFYLQAFSIVHTVCSALTAPHGHPGRGVLPFFMLLALKWRGRFNH